jgi:hypothetical protein
MGDLAAARAETSFKQAGEESLFGKASSIDSKEKSGWF